MLPSTLQIPNSARLLTSITRAFPLRSTSCSSDTLTLRSPSRIADDTPTPGTSHSGSCQPGHSAAGSARKAFQRKEGVERCVEGSRESAEGEEVEVMVGEEARGNEPQAGQEGFCARSLMVRKGEGERGESR